LLLAQKFLKPQSELFDVVIQCGAMLAVIAVFQKRVKEMATQFRQPATFDYILKLGTAFVMTCAGMLIVKKLGFHLEEKSMSVIAWASLIGGFVIFYVEYARKNKPSPSDITWLVAITVGLAQILAGSCPGTSRSGASIMFAMLVGISRPAATEFSFLLGIPTMFAAGAYKFYEYYKMHGTGAHEDWGALLVATAVSAIVAFLVVKWLLRFVQSHNFLGFAWYRVIMGGGILILLALKKMP
jgi:undecaprenyl-diphosphatase